MQAAGRIVAGGVPVEPPRPVGRQTSCPTIGALLRYRTRIVRVIAEARGQRAMIESLDTAGRAFVSPVKWGSLQELDCQLF